MKEALKNSNTFLGVGKPPACAELHTRPGKPEGLTLSRLGGPEAPHRQEMKARAGAAPPLGRNTGHPGDQRWRSGTPTLLSESATREEEGALSHTVSQEPVRETTVFNRRLRRSPSSRTPRRRREGRVDRCERGGDRARRRSAGLSWPLLAGPQGTAHLTGQARESTVFLRRKRNGLKGSSPVRSTDGQNCPLRNTVPSRCTRRT